MPSKKSKHLETSPTPEFFSHSNTGASSYMQPPAENQSMALSSMERPSETGGSQPPRKRHKFKQPDRTPEKSIASMQPFVQWQESQISVWWACSCGYQVLKHEELTCHGARRKKHLNKIHGISFNAMPPDPPGAPETNIAVRQSQEKLKRCKVWWSLAQQSGWTGLHQLIPCKKGYGWWQCLQCPRSFCKWKYAVTSHCPKNLGSTKGKAPSQERCVKMANKWWAQAQTQCTAEQQKCQELLNNWSFLNNQERLRRETKARSRPQLFGGIPAVPPEPTHSRVWWSCHLCDFQVVEGRQKSSSQARRLHLQKVHGFDTIPPLSRKGLSNFPSVQASVFVVQKRWRQQLEIFKQRAWAGAHVLEPAGSELRAHVDVIKRKNLPSSLFSVPTVPKNHKQWRHARQLV